MCPKKSTTNSPISVKGSMSPVEIGEISTAYRETVRSDPVGWSKNVLGVDLWYKQRQIIESLRDNKLVTVRSSNGVGKSFLAAVCTIWYLNWRCPGYVILSSSSWSNISRILWPEIRRILSEAPCKELGQSGMLLNTEWRLGEQWGAFSVGTKKAENFSGYRTKNGCMVIVDEASSLTEDIHEAIMGLLSVPGSRCLYIGNPLRCNGPFFQSFRSDNWTKFHISAYDSPNVKAGKDIIPGLANLDWINERLNEWGREHPAYAARIAGEFPVEGSDTLITLYTVEQAVNRRVREDIKEKVIMGVDIARYGADRTVIVVRRGKKVINIEAHSKESTMETAGRVLQAYAKFNPDEIIVDEIGVGGGVVDRLHELGLKCASGVNVSSAAEDPEMFGNLRAEAWWNVKLWLENGGSIPDHDGLKHDLCAPKLLYNSRSQIMIEPKDKTRARLGRSPDFGDAFMLTLISSSGGSLAFFVEDTTHASTIRNKGNWTIIQAG